VEKGLKFIARKFKEKKRYDIFKVVMTRCYKRAEKNKKSKSRKQVMAPKERDSKDVIIERAIKTARF